MPPQEESTSIQERRAAVRSTSSTPLSVTLSTTALEGRADNVSNAGVFFFSPERMRVEVHYELNGEQKVRSGHLVRVQRVSDETTAYAIEFERP